MDGVPPQRLLLRLEGDFDGVEVVCITRLFQRRQIGKRRGATRQQQHRQNRQNFLPHNAGSFTQAPVVCKVGFNA